MRMPRLEPTDNQLKRKADILAFKKKEANNLIASAKEAGFLTAGQAARLGDKVSAATSKTISAAYVEIVSSIGSSEPKQPAPEPDQKANHVDEPE